MSNLNIFRYPIIFETPKKIVEPYSWIGHIPFAFFLVSFLKPQLIVELGVHSGNSYNAFCQAVKALQTDTKCYGVDTWKGDEQTGFYDETVYHDLLEYQQNEYKEFSSLLKMTFDEALEHFFDRSIDLLHIDGRHTYKAVKHDYEHWLPKMNSKGIILFHDTNVREQNFGVWKLWEEISKAYPSFEFTHSYGLGVLILNKEVNKGLISFLSNRKNSAFYHSMFSKLGNVISLSQKETTRIKELIQQTEKEIQEKNRIIATLTPHYFSQFFIDTGSGFTEEQSIIKEISGTENRLEFDLSHYNKITALRFDPLNSRVVLELTHIKIITANNALHSELPYHTNALYQKENILIFETNDPIIYINMEGILNPQTVVIQVEYIAWGVETYKYIAEERASFIKVQEQEIQHHIQVIQTQHQEIQQQTHQLQARKQEMNRQAQTIRQQEQKLQAIYNTLSWKITAPLRTIWNICHLTEFFYTLRKTLYHIRTEVKGKDSLSLCLDNAELSYDNLTVSGWAISDSSIDRVEVYLDDLFIKNADYVRDRPDVEKVYPAVKHSCSSGFYLYVDNENLPELREGKYKITVKAINVRGQISEMDLTATVIDEAKEQFVQFAEKKLDKFLKTENILLFPEFEAPLLTIILILFNRSELTFQCLESIKAYGDVPYEIVIADNASTDHTILLLERLRNVTILKNTENIGFLKACNQAVEYARGNYLLFLNNDTQVLPRTFSSLVNTIESNPKVGVVGGKLIFPNGKLQEAGNIIWRDGSCVGYGRGDEPEKPEYSYLKEVYYCSGALLLTPRQLFLQFGKFDERYAPAYCEEVDYCLTVREHGYKVIYQPLAKIIHYEFASSKKSDEVIHLQRVNKEKLRKKWTATLTKYYEPQKENILFAKEYTIHKQTKRILFIDDRVPDPKLGSGFHRSFDMLNTLVDLGYHVTFFPLQFPETPASITNYFQQKGVEIIYDHTETKDKLNLGAFLKNRHHYYNILLVSRPHNMEEVLQLKEVLDDHTNNHIKVVYDCEALFALREHLYMKLIGQTMSEKSKETLIEKEIDLANHANSIITVSAKEKEIFARYEIPNLHVVGFAMNINPTSNAFDERQGILFVGAIQASPNPNEDAVLHFAKNIYPSVYEKTGAKLFIVGTNKSELVWELHSEHIIVVGQVESTVEYYNRCKIFIVPTRYAAGIPYKLYEAASYGVPAVVTALIAEQVGRQDGEGFLIGYNEAEFAQKCVKLYTRKDLWERIRQRALESVARDCHPQIFRENLAKALD